MAQLQSYVSAGQLTGETLVWAAGMSSWTRAAEVAALRELLVGLETPDAGKLDRALLDAEEAAAKPDRDEIGGAKLGSTSAACACSFSRTSNSSGKTI